MIQRRPRKSPTKVKNNIKRPLLPYLRGILTSLKPTERIIAESVLSDPESVISSSIDEFRKRAGASVGSIVAFCRLFGMKGFAEFKIELARDLAQSALPAGDSTANLSLFDKVFQFHTHSLFETVKINPTSTFEQAAEVLRKARRIEFFSTGLSFPIAYTAHFKFSLLGMQAGAQFDPVFQLTTATQLKAGDAAFGISCSGTGPETIRCLEVAKSHGAFALCLTNAINSPITKHADIALYASPSQINYFQASLASRVSQLAVIDALFVYLAQRDEDKTAQNLQRSGEELLRRRART